MNLIAISARAIINPDRIDYIEQRVGIGELVPGVSTDYIVIGTGGKEFVLTMPVKDFFDKAGINNMSFGTQHWAG